MGILSEDLVNVLVARKFSKFCNFILLEEFLPIYTASSNSGPLFGDEFS